MRGWPDRDIPRLAVQTAGIRASFPADAHDIRHGRQKVRFRLFECSPTHKINWVTRVVQGAPGNALGGFSRSRGYRGIRKGWGRGPAVRFRAVRRDGVYKRKRVPTQEGGRAQKLGELSDVDVSYAVPKRLHQLAFIESKWIAADPTQQTGWLIDIRISSPYVGTGQHHKVRKVTNSGTRLCSYVPETKNVVISEQYKLKTSNSREGTMKMVSEFSPAGIIGAGKEPTSTILLEVILGDPPDDSRSFARLQAQVDQRARAKRKLGALIRVRERPLVRFT